MHLTFDDHGVDLGAAIVDSDEAADLDFGSPWIDIDDTDVGAERVRQVLGVVTDLGFEATLDAFRKIASTVCLHRDVLDRDRLGRIALDMERTLDPFQISHRDFEHATSNDLCLVFDLASNERRGSTGNRCRTGAVGTQTKRGVVGVAMNVVDVFGRDTDLFGDDLGEGYNKYLFKISKYSKPLFFWKEYLISKYSL